MWFAIMGKSVLRFCKKEKKNSITTNSTKESEEEEFLFPEKYDHLAFVSCKTQVEVKDKSGLSMWDNSEVFTILIWEHVGF